MENIKWNMYPSGSEFTGSINGNKVEGKINYGIGGVYLCQDKISGANILNKFGYKYSWNIGKGSNDVILNNRTEIKSLTSSKIGDNDEIIIKPYSEVVNDSFYLQSNNIVIRITIDCFYNCQSLVIGGGENFLYGLKENNILSEKKKEWFNILRSFKSFSILDIHQNYRKYLIELIKESNIMFIQEYRSTNESEMMLVGINNNNPIK